MRLWERLNHRSSLDRETSLYYFGNRYYHPSHGRWTTLDPAGFIDGTNLYTYVLNNPLSYADFDGRDVGGFLLGCGEIALGSFFMVSGVVIEFATFGGYTFAFGFQEAAGLTLITHGLTLTSLNAQDLSFEPTRSSLEASYDFTFLEKKKQGGRETSDQKYKKPKAKVSGKEGAKDVPSWAKGSRPYEGESGKDFAKRLMDEKYGPGNYEKGTNSPFNQIKKWGDRSWE